MASGRRIQGSSVAIGIVVGFVLYAVTRHIFWIAIGVALGAAFVALYRRR